MAMHLAALTRRSTAAFADSIRSFISPFDDWGIPLVGQIKLGDTFAHAPSSGFDS
jgi:hypothetical protein